MQVRLETGLETASREMRRMTIRRMLLLGLVVVAMGCGKGTSQSPGQNLSLSDVRFGLQQIANGGPPQGTLMDGIDMGIANLKKTDPAKAESLQKEIAELKKVPQAQAPSKAKQILEKLDAAK